MLYPLKVHIKKGDARALKSGGAWIYDNEIEYVEGKYEDGDIVTVLDFDGYCLGHGFINSSSKIRVRMMTRNADQAVNDELLRMRISDAWSYRKKVTDTSSCRLIFGEADFLPGLVVDKYEDVLVVESLALGMDRMKIKAVEILKQVLLEDNIIIRGVYERSDSKERLKEGMERVTGFIGPCFDTDVLITENGVKYLVDTAGGQKTGFFLDQKYNRLAIRRLSVGAKVLDCFTHTGSFALNAAQAGAVSVSGIDASESAIIAAKKNAALNSLEDKTKFITGDAFDFLTQQEKAGEVYDMVILDPPAFTKSRDSIRNAVKGYREINLKGMKLVRDGGFLATCTCSHFMDRALFEKTLMESARGAHRRLRQVESRTQAPDHPILWTNDNNSSYLKFYIFQVSKEK